MAYQGARTFPCSTLETLWDQLASAKGTVASHAMDRLETLPKQTLVLLRHHLHPAAHVDPMRVCRLLADLDSKHFKVRKQATEELGNNSENWPNRSSANTWPISHPWRSGNGSDNFSIDSQGWPPFRSRCEHAGQSRCSNTLALRRPGGCSSGWRKAAGGQPDTGGQGFAKATGADSNG